MVDVNALVLAVGQERGCRLLGSLLTFVERDQKLGSWNRSLSSGCIH